MSWSNRLRGPKFIYSGTNWINCNHWNECNEWRIIQTDRIPQSKYPVLQKGAFGGTRFLFLVCLSSRASPEKTIWGQLWATCKSVFFVYSGSKKTIFWNIVASALKSCILSLLWKFLIFFPQNRLIHTQIHKFENLSVCTT